MDYREQHQHRPPRSAPPRNAAASPASISTYSDSPVRPSFSPTGQYPQQQRGNVSFQVPEQSARRYHGSAYDRQGELPPTPDELAQAEVVGDSFETRVGRKKSLVRPDREKIEPGHRQWYYRNHAAQLEDEGKGRVGLMPSSAHIFFYHSDLFN